jgi:hypothetical protein
MSINEQVLKSSLWLQFGAAIDMFESALVACPDELWHFKSQQQEFWYMAYHCLFWTDLYLSGSLEGFTPPAPFDLNEVDPAGKLPAHEPNKDELLAYVTHCRAKCRAAIDTLTDEKASRPCKFPWGEATYLELMLDTMRHVQGHAAELLWILGQKTGSAPGWISRTKKEE